MGFHLIPLYAASNDYKDAIFAILYLMLTAYLFVGIAIASDLFMSAIEQICSATKTIVETKDEGDGVIITVTRHELIWNDTVANLTLMALGSSAPEILLSCIEISEGLGAQEPGDLGPGTIVGSAAFNLLIISGLCICSLKDGATSRIKLYNVFIVTSVFSLFAYIWMVVVLQYVTPDQVDIWEALLTLLFCPLLVGIAYWADRDFCIWCIPGFGKYRRTSVASGGTGKSEEERQLYFGDEDEDNLYDDQGNVDNRALQNLYYKLREVAILTPEEITTILATKLIQSKHHTRSWYRTKAAKILLGSGTGMPPLDEKLKEVVDVIGVHNRKSVYAGALHAAASLKSTVTSAETYKTKAVVEFQAAALAVQEAIGTVQIAVNRTGKEDVGFTVKVDSVDGLAKAGQHYHAVSQTLTFDPYVKEMMVDVTIIDNSEWNPDSQFYLRLTIAEESKNVAVVGQMGVIGIIIEDDEKPGKLAFMKRGYRFKDTVKVGYLEVERTDGNDGPIAVSWKTLPGPECTIIPPDLTGKVEFAGGEKVKVIEISFLPLEGEIHGHEQTFDVELFAPEGGAKLGKVPVTTCAVTNDESFKLQISHVMTAAIQESEKSEEEVTWKEQICNSIYPNDGEWREATWKQWVLHIFVFPFKFTLALIPPPHIWRGWPCFILALLAIGVLTKLVGDSATSFGAACHIKPVITAITVVALGTSLPDTFASMIAARNDKTADNAIGNVTGSNSVNVFLGLGLPWTIGSLYYHFTDQEYTGLVDQTQNPSGPNQPKNLKHKEPFCVLPITLSFNVVIFTICAVLALAILAFRRQSSLCGKAELGGPSNWKWITAIAMIMLWFIYIGLSILPVYYPAAAKPFSLGENYHSECEYIKTHLRDKKYCSNRATCPYESP